MYLGKNICHQFALLSEHFGGTLTLIVRQEFLIADLQDWRRYYLVHFASQCLKQSIVFLFAFSLSLKNPPKKQPTKTVWKQCWLMNNYNPLAGLRSCSFREPFLPSFLRVCQSNTRVASPGLKMYQYLSVVGFRNIWCLVGVSCLFRVDRDDKVIVSSRCRTFVSWNKSKTSF